MTSYEGASVALRRQADVSEAALDVVILHQVVDQFRQRLAFRGRAACRSRDLTIEATGKRAPNSTLGRNLCTLCAAHEL